MTTWRCDREGCPSRIEVAAGGTFCLPPSFIRLEYGTGAKYEFCSEFCLELFTHPKLMEQARKMATFGGA